ncbi:hypothetical protein A8709_26590 [Paenibacillus pectinilyticus]|uniref:Uncharacterized protein n=1 Tax=Paenibacillus pectinilyticus TaxID=512399 RepID=A0A1C1A1H9_9BACL|nr:hypothetical protein A8709_26590 [Paenibacillus pectinilyticus]
MFSQTQEFGGLGLSATITSVIFLLAILLIIIFLSITKRNLVAPSSTKAAYETKGFAVIWQVVVVVGILVLEVGSGYYWRSTNLQDALPQGDSTSYVQQASNYECQSNVLLRASF